MLNVRGPLFTETDRHTNMKNDRKSPLSLSEMAFLDDRKASLHFLSFFLFFPIQLFSFFFVLQMEGRVHATLSEKLAMSFDTRSRGMYFTCLGDETTFSVMMQAWWPCKDFKSAQFARITAQIDARTKQQPGTTFYGGGQMDDRHN